MQTRIGFSRRFGSAFPVFLLAVTLGNVAVAQNSHYLPEWPAVLRGQEPFEADDPMTPRELREPTDYADVPAEDTPGHIRDNAFLVEEAFNQETGVAQHIFNWIISWDRGSEVSTRDFVANYTMELPIGSQKHQFSFTPQFLSSFEKPDGQPAEQHADVGDTFLNYRYQLLANDDFLWCAPRFTLILPTADERFGIGTGKVGYQFNLPISKYGDRFDFHFNLGGTIVPGVSLPSDGGSGDLRACNVGASSFWKPRTNLNFFTETLVVWAEDFNDLGDRQSDSLVFVNPGVRYALCQFDDVEWVVGTSVPIGLTSETPDIGLFAYMSVEHVFRRTEQ